jgi:hypothetical protein
MQIMVVDEWQLSRHSRVSAVAHAAERPWIPMGRYSPAALRRGSRSHRFRMSFALRSEHTKAAAAAAALQNRTLWLRALRQLQGERGRGASAAVRCGRTGWRTARRPVAAAVSSQRAAVTDHPHRRPGRGPHRQLASGRCPPGRLLDREGTLGQGCRDPGARRFPAPHDRAAPPRARCQAQRCVDPRPGEVRLQRRARGERRVGRQRHRRARARPALRPPTP